MVKLFTPFATSVAFLVAAATATAVPDGSWPASTGTVQYAEAYVIKAGEVFDGKMQTFERSDVSCQGQTESNADTAVFMMEPGATLKNAIIGKNQMEGVHCDKHDCTIDNVWWDDVCEDALSIKGGTASSVSTVTNCGARYADDKVIQHNGYGTVKIDGFYGEDISKLYRSCGTCGDRPKKVSVSNSYIVNPGNAIVTVNKNWGDEATLKNIWVKSSKASVKVCQWSQGNANGEPKMLGNGPSPPLCQYSESDVHINENISQAKQTSPSSTSSSSGDVTQAASSASTASSGATQTSPSSSTASSGETQTSSATTDSSVASSASPASSSSQNPTQTSSSSTTGSASYQASSNSSTDASEGDAPGTVAPVESGSFEQSVISSDASQTQQQDLTEEPTATPSVSSSSSGSLYSSEEDVSQTAVQQSSVASSDAYGSTTSSSSSTTSQSSTAGSTTQSSSNGSGNQSSDSESVTQNSGSDSVTQNAGSDSTTQTATNSTGTVPDGSWPASTGTVQYAKAYVIKAGEVFDGKMQTFERSDVSCQGQTESNADTAVRVPLKNAIIGKNQMEGVHCDKHDCTIDNVWWDDVCEDALSIKGGTASSVSTVTNCGARYADDKVIQHNGYGTVKIDGFYGEDISKLYRSCGTCGDRPKKVSVSNSYIVNPGNAIVTVNKNWGDEATLKNIWVKSSKASVKVCQWSQGNANGEPKMLGNGPSPPLCQYSESDVHINEDIYQAKQTSPSSTSSSSGDVTQAASSASTASSGATQTSPSSSTASSGETQTSSATTDSSVASSASPASSSSQNPTQTSSSSTTGSASYQASSSSSMDASEGDAPGTVAPVESGSFEQSVISSDASQTQQQDLTEEPTATPSVSSSSSGSLYSSEEDVSQTAVQQSSVASSDANGSTTSSSSSTTSQSSTAGSTTQSSSNGSGNQSSDSESVTQNSGSDSVTQNAGSDSTTQTATNSTGTVPDGSWPASTGTVQYAKAYIIKAGEVFDGKMQTFERSDVSCQGQTEAMPTPPCS
ncbi:hypothetical protein PInf_015184 [Phytophthora infestans]|nr:hypothetical protein PInf_015184 [Phytophthora infestans]